MADKEKLHEFDVEAFAAGTWNGDKYTQEDLEDMVRNFDALKDTVKPPVKLGHNESQLKDIMADGQPALGWVKSLRCVKDKIIATLTQVPEIVYKAIRSGRYKRVSSEIYWNYKQGGKVFNKVFAGLALLGADIPAVSSLKDLEAFLSQSMQDASFERVAAYSFETDESGSQITDRKGDAEMSDDIKKYQDEIAALKSQVADLTPQAAEALTYKAELEAIRKKDADARKASQENDLKTLCEQMVKDGKLPPACRDILVAFDRHSYSEDAGYSLPVSAVVEALKTFEKVILKTDEKGEEQKDKGGEEKPVFEEATEKAKAYMKEHKVGLGEAYRAIFSADADLYDRYLQASTNRSHAEDDTE